MTKKEFSNIIKQVTKNRPENWRYGQAIFNYTSELFGVARKVQMFEHIDCFYDDILDEIFHEYHIGNEHNQDRKVFITIEHYLY